LTGDRRVGSAGERLSNQSDAPPPERQREAIVELNRDVVTEEAFRRSHRRRAHSLLP
jgi:hypothetical protein